MRKEQLNYLRFPLGAMLKKETREIAKNLDLNVADKPDSQDICFVPSGDYASVIEKFNPSSFQKGNIKDLEGNILCHFSWIEFVDDHLKYVAHRWFRNDGSIAKEQILLNRKERN